MAVSFEGTVSNWTLRLGFVFRLNPLGSGGHLALVGGAGFEVGRAKFNGLSVSREIRGLVEDLQHFEGGLFFQFFVLAAHHGDGAVLHFDRGHGQFLGRGEFGLGVQGLVAIGGTVGHVVGQFRSWSQVQIVGSKRVHLLVTDEIFAFLLLVDCLFPLEDLASHLRQGLHFGKRLIPCFRHRVHLILVILSR